eukprot:gene1893-2576_t
MANMNSWESTLITKNLDEAGYTALHYAAAGGHVQEVIDLLRQRAIDPNIENKNDTTALLLAAGNGHEKVITELLADARVNPNKLNREGVSALHLAAQRGRVTAVTCLLQCSRVNPNLTGNVQRNSALHLAAYHGKLKSVQALCANSRVVLNFKNAKGRTPEDLALEHGHKQVATALQNEAKAREVTSNQKIKEQAEVMARACIPPSASQAKRRKEEAEAAAKEAAGMIWSNPTLFSLFYADSRIGAGTGRTADDPAKSNFDEVAKKTYRKLTLRWHPDKWDAKYGKRIKEEDRERILQQVKTVSQALNRAWDSGMY